MMRLTVYQSITIYSINVKSISNSSVLQIGSAGMIKPLSNRFQGADESARGTLFPAFAPAAPLVPLPEPAADEKKR